MLLVSALYFALLRGASAAKGAVHAAPGVKPPDRYPVTLLRESVIDLPRASVEWTVVRPLRSNEAVRLRLIAAYGGSSGILPETSLRAPPKAGERRRASSGR